MADEHDEMQPEPVSFRFNLDGPDDYIGTSAKLSEDGRVDEATDVMREAAARYPNDARAHYGLGMALMLALKADLARQEIWEPLSDEEAMAEEAQSALQKCVECDPAMWQALTALGTLLAVRGRRDKAVEVWTRSLELNPDQPEVRADMEMVGGRSAGQAEGEADAAR